VYIAARVLRTYLSPSGRRRIWLRLSARIHICNSFHPRRIEILPRSRNVYSSEGGLRRCQRAWVLPQQLHQVSGHGLRESAGSNGAKGTNERQARSPSKLRHYEWCAITLFFVPLCTPAFELLPPRRQIVPLGHALNRSELGLPVPRSLSRLKMPSVRHSGDRQCMVNPSRPNRRDEPVVYILFWSSSFHEPGLPRRRGQVAEQSNG